MADLTPTVPGYRILRPLGRGGMASVYLAIQESVEREVALKIMAPQLSADPSFGERFLREARIAAKLHHRHVVSIFDVGVHDGIHYCAMEYLPGGPVMRRGSPPLALKPTIRCVREIASALHYAQEKGFIHRDVKPDNILLREDGSCVLSDFGIARAADSGTIMTKTGAVVGTPHYMSPEQLRGRAIDGRADLYSLGVVFFQLLSGRVPYEASDSLAVGIMHMTAPLPQLPGEYRFLQPILERMLAKEPAERFQTGAEIDAALAEAERRIAAGTADTPPPPRRGSQTPTKPIAPIRADRKPYDSQGAVRTEPQIGRIEDVDRPADALHVTPRPQNRTQIRPAAAPPRRIGPWIALVLLVGLAALAYWQRPLLTEWAQRQWGGHAETEVEAGDRALAEGRWYSDDGKDAMALYTAALMLDSSDARARRGLEDTLGRLLQETGRNRDPVRIQGIVRRLNGVRGFESQQQAFIALLKTTTTAPELPPAESTALTAAAQAESAGRLSGADGALDRYARIARAEPGNAEARRGVDRVAAALATEARALLDSGDLAAAERLRLELLSIPAAAGVAEQLRSAIEDHRAASDRRSAIERLLREGRDLAAAGSTVEPRGNSAAERYLAVLKQDAGNRDAQRGLDQALAAALVQAAAALDKRDTARAQQLLARVQALAPRTAGLKDLKVRLDAAVEAAKAPSPEQLALRDKLIREGELALSTEQLVEPPGDSAWDKFRGALRIDPKSDSAKAGIDAVAEALRTRAREALTAGRMVKAHGDIQALETVNSRDPQLPVLKRETARLYAERGLRMLADNKIAEARTDLRAAESLDDRESKVAELRMALVGR
ncbi:MAG: protein kinase [Lysobacterales bacterium]